MKKLLRCAALFLLVGMLAACGQSGQAQVSSVTPPASSDTASQSTAPAPPSSSASMREWTPPVEDVIVKMTIDDLFTETGFTLAPGYPLGMPIDDYVAKVPNGELLDPESDKYEETQLRRLFHQGRNGQPDETSLRPAIQADFTDLDYVLGVSANFDEEENLLYGGYHRSLYDEEEHTELLKAILLKVFDRHPEAFMRSLEDEVVTCGREVVDTLDDIDFMDGSRLTVAWQSKADNSFMEVSTHSLTIVISVGLPEGQLANRWWMDIDDAAGE